MALFHHHKMDPGELLWLRRHCAMQPPPSIQLLRNLALRWGLSDTGMVHFNRDYFHAHGSFRENVID